MNIERTNLRSLVVNQLPDGSKIIVDSDNGTVFALNAMAGAAWDACDHPTDLLRVTEQLRVSLNPQTTEEFARRAILELEEKNLVRTWGSSPHLTRRHVLGSLSAAVALPLVVSLSMSDQRAFAQNSGSRFERPHANPAPARPPLRIRWW
ncbi:MAG: PqqD family protein [Terracidiphilus sp.]